MAGALSEFRKAFTDWLKAEPALLAFVNGNADSIYFQKQDEDATLPSIRISGVHRPQLAALDSLYASNLQVDFYGKDSLATIEAAQALFDYAAIDGTSEPKLPHATLTTNTLRPTGISRSGVVAAPDIRGVYVSTVGIDLTWYMPA